MHPGSYEPQTYFHKQSSWFFKYCGLDDLISCFDLLFHLCLLQFYTALSFMFHRVFSPQARSKYLFTFSPPFTFHLCSDETAKFTITRHQMWHYSVCHCAKYDTMSSDSTKCDAVFGDGTKCGTILVMEPNVTLWWYHYQMWYCVALVPWLRICFRGDCLSGPTLCLKDPQIENDIRNFFWKLGWFVGASYLGDSYSKTKNSPITINSYWCNNNISNIFLERNCRFII